ncbi:hypothetical protein RQN30_07500 [Arcanobacterium hippocoleae]
MYGFIWRYLPGPKWLKAIEAAVIIFAIVAFLFTYGFPWINDYLGLNENTVG